MLRNIFFVVTILFISNCSSVTDPAKTHKYWYPNANKLRDASTEILQNQSLNGDVEASLILGMRMANGDRIKNDPVSAFLIFQKLANKNDPRAQYLLGAAYASGLGTDKDEQIAVKWFKKSALNGYDKGQYWYAHMLSRGRGVKYTDWEEAIKWFKKASIQGHTNAQFSLGEAYEQCRGRLDRNFDKAAQWYRIADKYTDNMLARYNLRRLIDLGLTDWKEGDAGTSPNKFQDITKESFISCSKGIKDPFLSEDFKIRPILTAE